MKRLAVLTVALLGLLTAGCGSSSSSSSAPAGSTPSATQSSPQPSGNSTHVTIQNLAFNPPTIHAKVGQTITWVNDDNPPHNVTYVSGPKFASSPTMNPGTKFSLKLTQAGTIQYFCSIHPFMKASIVVSP